MLHIKEVPHVAQWLRAYACIGMREGFTNMVGMMKGSYTRDSCSHYFVFAWLFPLVVTWSRQCRVGWWVGLISVGRKYVIVS